MSGGRGIGQLVRLVSPAPVLMNAGPGQQGRTLHQDRPGLVLTDDARFPWAGGARDGASVVWAENAPFLWSDDAIANSTNVQVFEGNLSVDGLGVWFIVSVLL